MEPEKGPDVLSGMSSGNRFASWPPPLKLVAWMAAVFLLAALSQGAASLLGIEFNILSQSNAGRGTLVVLALVSLLVLMAADRRPAADYGLVISGDWLRQWLGGLSAGIGTYAVYCAAALAAGAFHWGTMPGAYRSFSITLAALGAVPLAISQQVIFSGYLVHLLNRYGRVISVTGAALLFAVASDPLSLLSPQHQQLMCGLFLTQTLLGLLRLSYGTVLVPAGVLAGWIAMRRLIHKSGLLIAGDPAVAEWLAPHTYLRQAPIMWLILAVAIVVVSRGKAATCTGRQPAIATSFKRVAPLSNLCMFAPLDIWLGRLWQVRMSIDWKYIPRLISILIVSAFNTLLTLPERLLLPLLLRGRPVSDPVFILGVHRSGTTHLQNVLALDPALVTPVTHQVMNPHGFLFSGWLLMPLLAAFTPWRRPMDAVRFHAFAPNEEEFALAGLSRLSPYWGQTFPRQIADYDRYIFPAGFTPRELAAWQRCYLRFLRMLTFWSSRRPLLKNPHNTARVAVLRRMFPSAKFIHIYRQPFAVYRSNVHLAREGHCTMQLQDPDEHTGYAGRFLDNYLAMEDAYYRDTADLPPQQCVEVCFEDLERDPLHEVRRIYQQLRLPWDATLQRRMEEYLAGLAGYQKNRFHPLADDLREQIYGDLRPLFDRWGYDARGDRPPGARDRAA